MNKLASPLVALALAVTAAGMPHAQPAAERFDYLVREDMFRGYAGDTAALERAMALCEARLAENPEHAEALVGTATACCSCPGKPSASATTTRGRRLLRRRLSKWARQSRSAPTMSASASRAVPECWRPQ